MGEVTGLREAVVAQVRDGDGWSHHPVGQTPRGPGEERFVRRTEAERVLPGGSDWIVVRRDGVLIQDVRLMLETDDNHVVLMSYRGMRHGPRDTRERLDRGEDVDPPEYYFRTAPIFEAPYGKYDWLNKLLAFAVGWRLPTGVVYSAYALL